MLKRKVFLVYIFLCILFVTRAIAQTSSLLDGRKWSVSSFGSGLSSGYNLQGSAFLSSSLNGIDGHDKIYLFRQTSDKTKNAYDIYDITTNTWSKGEDELTFMPFTHCGSASFAPSVVESYVKDGTTYHCTIPFVYATSHAKVNDDGTVTYEQSGTDSNGKPTYTQTTGTKYEIVNVIDLQNHLVVARFCFPDRTDDCIAAYDFNYADNTSRVWIIGYQQGVVGKSPYVLEEYHISNDIFLSTNPSKTIFTHQDVEFKGEMQGGGPNADGVQDNLECGTVQDVFYHENHLYMCTGRGSLYNRTEWVKLHCYSVAPGVANHGIVKTIVSPDCQESQGLVFDGTNIWMAVGVSNNLWKFSPGQGYDNYNFEPAIEASSNNYLVSNGSQLCWFLQQVYGGRTTINATLTADIDMLGVKLPTSFYVYEYDNDKGMHTFEAQYAFRGVFDGQGHTISNLNISSTPYYNDGLFPYVKGGTVKDVTVKGSVTLTRPKSPDNTTEVRSVGVVGTLDGGTVSGVNSAEFMILNPNSLTLINENGVGRSLIGHVIEGSVTSFENNVTTYGSHAENGAEHHYVNGICTYPDCTVADGMYEEPQQDGTTRLLGNAGNLLWFANYVNAGNGSTNAMLTSNIDIEGRKYTFPSIADNNTLPYKGTFDGNGKTISNFYMEITSGGRKGLFGTATGATIMHLTVEGDIVLEGTSDKFFIGGVAGQASGKTTIEDVTSRVNITVNGSSRHIGGIVGCAPDDVSTLINRCQYSGTINVNAVQTGNYPQSIGGICGDLRKGKVTNSLFDGIIVSSVTDPNAGNYPNINVAGIVGNNANAGNTVSNCLAHGTMNIKDNTSSHCAAIIGWNRGSVNGSNNHYTTQNLYAETGTISAIGVNSSTVSDPVCVTDLTMLTNGDVLIALGETDWIQGESYPVPLVGGGGSHQHVFDEDGYCKCGECQEATLVDGFYEISNAGQFFWFADKANTSVSTNAKLKNDINLKNKQFNGIGNSSKKYSGTFDGNGKKITGYSRPVADSPSENGLGLFNYTNGATIKALRIEGEMPFTCTKGIAFVSTLVGQAENSLIEDVTSAINMTFAAQCNGTVNSGIRIVGGLVGRSIGSTISRCRYSGTMDLTANATMGDRFAGVVGDVNTSANTIANCLFDGVIKLQATSNITIAGILAKREGSDVTIENCLSVGALEFASGTNTSISGMIVGNKNGTALSHMVSNSYYDKSKTTIGGQAITNELVDAGTSLSLATTLQDKLSALLGYAWLPSSDADYPIPSNIESSADGHYVLQYTYLDDLADKTSLPTDAKSIHTKHLVYSRDASYMTQGYISVCLPFALSDACLPGGADCAVKLFDGLEYDNNYSFVNFREVDHAQLEAGVPYFIYLPERMCGQTWNIDIEDASGIALVPEPVNPTVGIMGEFNTTLIGKGAYKLNPAGNKLLKTTASSQCYPYRGYLKLPQDNSTREMILVFDDEETTIQRVLDSDEVVTQPTFNFMGQRVKYDIQGIVIRNGKKYINR